MRRILKGYIYTYLLGKILLNYIKVDSYIRLWEDWITTYTILGNNIMKLSLPKKDLIEYIENLILANFPDAYKIGCTATPIRLDGRGLKDYFDDLVASHSLSNLIE